MGRFEDGQQKHVLCGTAVLGRASASKKNWGGGGGAQAAAWEEEEEHAAVGAPVDGRGGARGEGALTILREEKEGGEVFVSFYALKVGRNA